MPNENDLKIKLGSLAGGAVAERFDKAVKDVARNILDPNTDYKKPREVIVKLKFTSADENRDYVNVSAEVSSKLVPHVEVPTRILIGANRDGEIFINELTPSGALVEESDSAVGVPQIDDKKVSYLDKRQAALSE